MTDIAQNREDCLVFMQSMIQGLMASECPIFTFKDAQVSGALALKMFLVDGEDKNEIAMLTMQFDANTRKVRTGCYLYLSSKRFSSRDRPRFDIDDDNADLRVQIKDFMVKIGDAVGTPLSEGHINRMLEGLETTLPD